jgi:GTP:adenosylcobinamide-phosphate guanylyltransferase
MEQALHIAAARGRGYVQDAKHGLRTFACAGDAPIYM